MNITKIRLRLAPLEQFQGLKKVSVFTTIILFLMLKVRKILKGGNYSREETIQRRKLLINRRF